MYSRSLAGLLLALAPLARGIYQVQKPLLDTPWTNSSGTNAWPEYPRPQLRRAEWQNLNGLWRWQEAEAPGGGGGGGGGRVDGRDAPPLDAMASEILVPSCIESALSGIMRPNMTYSWFARTFEVPSSWTAGDDDDDDERGNNTNKNKNRNSRVVLNFDSVDYEATVFVNGRAAGRHVGGYFRFSLDVTDYLVAGSNTLHVHVFDPTDSAGWSVAVGKQALTPSHIFYTPCTGIWKSVWLEPVPEQYITDLNIAADMNGQVNMTVSTNEVRTRPVRVVVSDGCNGTIAVANGTTGSPFVFQATLPQLWSPDSPNLYNLTVWMGSDEVHSYTGFRTLSTGLVDGVRRPLVNGAFFFHMGALDQGYWPDGVYTPPGRDAMLSDLALLRRLGFNMVRKHMKVESDLWYRACDELGLLVVQDMPAMPSGGLPDATQQEEWERQVGMLVKQHRNFPSIYTWVIYNEGWGQLTDYYPEAAIARDIARADPTRFVDATSGWVDHGLGDWHDNHHYSSPQCGTPFYSAPDSQHSGARMAIQGEFGGIGNNVSAAHLWPVAAAVETINQTYELTATTAVWNFRAHELLGQLRAQVQRWDCSAAVWTQTTDVEGEVNGLVTYDRRLLRADVAQWQRDIRALKDAAEARGGNRTSRLGREEEDEEQERGGGRAGLTD